MQSHRRQSAFTMVELLVAVLILGLIGLFVNQLFMHTQRAVSTGIRTGELLVESESIGDQIARDARAMFPPTLDPVQPGGILVIINKLYPNMSMHQIEGGDYEQNIRSDQLLFIISDVDGPLASLTPQHNETLGSDESDATYARVAYGHAMRTEPDSTTATGMGAPGYNYFANQWALGRQQLLLVDPAPGVALDANQVYAASARADATVTIYPGSPQLYHGVTDVAAQQLWDTVNPGIINSIATYPDGVYPFTFAEYRLRVNPTPQGFEAWQVAQTHPLLAQNVSDFIVEFAGDYEGGAVAGEGDGEIDRDGAGNIKWYGYWYNNTTAGRRDPADPINSTTYDSASPSIYEPLAGLTTAAPTGNPLTNLAYYDAASGLSNADAVFTFRHDDGDPATSKWPYLLRIRYRLHDSQGRIQSTVGGGPQQGRWFEHIIPVARP